MKESISAIIPTYNERESIGAIIDTITAQVYPLEEIIVVDDDSPDATWQVVQQLQGTNEKLKLIRRRNVKGLASALQEGVSHSQGNVVAWFDADFASLPSTLSGLFALMGENDIVVASRYCAGAKDAREEKVRVLASRIFNRVAQSVLKTRTKDLTSGYIIAKKSIFNTLKLSGVYGEYCVKFLYEAEQKGLKVKEAPYVCLSRKEGKSKTSSSVFTFARLCLIYVASILKIKFTKYEKNT